MSVIFTEMSILSVQFQFFIVDCSNFAISNFNIRLFHESISINFLITEILTLSFQCPLKNWPFKHFLNYESNFPKNLKLKSSIL